MWFTQKLDHYDPQNAATWQQKYYMNDTFYQLGNPIFLYISGEGPMAPKVVTSLQVNEYARLYGALVVALEHRFYGDSQPFPDLSTPNLKFLSSQQALADLAYFRQEFNKAHGRDDTKWIVFGGSYAGAMSSWFRLKYPQLVSGAVASSGPVHAELDFYQYLQVVQNSLLSVGGQPCLNAVRSSFQSLQAMVTDSSNWPRLQTQFKLCSALTCQADVYNFMANVIGYFQGVVQYDNEQPTALNITDICTMMTNQSDPLLALTAVNDYFVAQSTPACLDALYSDMLAQFKNVSIEAGSAVGRQWMYQTCTEFGYFQTTSGSGDTQPFGTLSPLSAQTQLCQDLFDLPADNPHIEWTNTFYGSDQPASYNVVFPNGSLDPWHALGALEPHGAFQYAIYIEGTAHCADLHVYREGNPPGLQAAQKEIAALIGAWLAE